MRKQHPKNGLSASRRTILDLLKRNGPQDAQSMAAQLDVTAMAIRQHLYELEKSGLVHFREEPSTIGRPAKVWRLAPGAEAFYPDGHADLSVELLGAMRQAFGEASLEKLIRIRAGDQRLAYTTHLKSAKSLKGKLRALAELRTDEGYMAEVLKDDGDGFLLIENHCPICAAANICQGLCQAELDVFRDVLGDDVTVERVEHIPLGARRCAYRVQPKIN